MLHSPATLCIHTPVFLMCFVWCCPSWMYCAHPAVRLIQLQWTRSLEDHNRDFLDVYEYLTYFPEFALIDFCYGLNSHFQSTFICDGPRGLIHLSGSPFTVGKVEENPSPKHFFAVAMCLKLGKPWISALPSPVLSALPYPVVPNPGVPALQVQWSHVWWNSLPV